MIRKQTWILLIIFVILAAAVFYFQKNPTTGINQPTPGPTAHLKMVEGWTTGEITRMEFQDELGNTTQLQQDAQGNWVLQPAGKPVSLGKVEELRTQILDATALSILDSNASLEPVGLSKPAVTIILSSSQSRQAVIHIGNLTPTSSGYYVKVNDQPPAVISRFAVESFLSLMKEGALLEYTPTPFFTPAVEATGTP
jgi:hypothetical protein